MNYIHGLLFFMKPRRIRTVKLGQKIEIIDTQHGEKAVLSKWVVTEIYPFFVRARRKTIKGEEQRTFNLGELVQMGYEPTGGMAP